MKTLFERVFEEHGRQCTDKVTEGCEWVLNEPCVATRKFDGTCCLIENNKIYRRFDYKAGRTLPVGAIPCQEKADEVAGHFPHWVLCDENNPADKWHIKAFESQKPLKDGTYELCGEHFQNNIDKMTESGDVLVKHGWMVQEGDFSSYEAIKSYLENHYIEGIVFYRANGDMCKIKRSDFGFEWGKKR